jgi:arginine-tRNA-protein transferase
MGGEGCCWFFHLLQYFNIFSQMFYHDSFSPESLSGMELDHLLAHGWYRMHQSVFTTSHVDLVDVYRVHWLRFPVVELKDHRSHRKLRSRNSNFTFTINDADEITVAESLLYGRYRQSIAFDGALNIDESLFGEGGGGNTIFNTKRLSVYDKDELIACSYFDVGEISAASILNFFNPEYKRFSLGRYLILLTIDYLKEQGYAYYYPGYILGGSDKMNYKLFLGREEAQYFDPGEVNWKGFHEGILIRQPSDD